VLRHAYTRIEKHLCPYAGSDLGRATPLVDVACSRGRWFYSKQIGTNCPLCLKDDYLHSQLTAWVTSPWPVYFALDGYMHIGLSYTVPFAFGKETPAKLSGA
jgi:hypothetical protein